MSDNRVDGVLAAADAQAVLAAVKTIRDTLPFLIDLSPDEKRSLPALGEASRGFVAKALEGARQNPDFLPKSFVLDAAQRDLDLFDALLPISLALTQLQELVDDTVHAAGGEAYNDARLVYQFAKAAPPSSGLDQFVKDLSARFARRTAPAAPKPAAPPTTGSTP